MKEIDRLQKQIIDELHSLILHLEKYEEKQWADYFRKMKLQIENGDIRAIIQLTRIRGGMGSFSDLVSCKINGHNIEKQDEHYANLELMRLGDKVIASAFKIKRSY